MIRTLIEIIVVALFIFCFWHKEKIIAFEQNVVRFFKDIIFIFKSVKKQNMSLKHFLSICYLYALQEFEERHPKWDTEKRKLVREIILNIIAIFIAIMASILIIQKWG